MKIILTSDIHAGVKADSDIFLKTFSDFFNVFLPEVIEAENPECLYILGDLFDNRNNLNLKTLNIVLEEFKKFSEKYSNIQILILLGNHDIYYRTTKEVNSIKILEQTQNIKIIDSLMTMCYPDGTKAVMCPWLVNDDEVNNLFKNKADFCFGHFEINGFEMVPGVREQNGLSQDRFRNNFKLTFSGHFHLRDELNGIIYLGNPYPTKWSDVSNTKGVYVLDTTTLKYTFIENTHAPQFKKIFLSQLKKGLKTAPLLKNEIANNFISLVIDEDIKPKELDKLNYLFSECNPLSFNVIDKEKSYDIIPIEDISTSPLEVLFEYVQRAPLPSNIDKETLSIKITELYQKIESE